MALNTDAVLVGHAVPRRGAVRRVEPDGAINTRRAQATVRLSTQRTPAAHTALDDVRIPAVDAPPLVADAALPTVQLRARNARPFREERT